ELVDLDGALAAFRDALDRVPAHEGARAGLMRLLRSPAHIEAALDLLEPLYEGDGDHARSVDLAEVRLTVTRERADQVQLLERIADRAEHQLGDGARALEALARALQLAPEETRLADEVERVARASQHDPQAAEIFERVLDAGGV